MRQKQGKCNTYVSLGLLPALETEHGKVSTECKHNTANRGALFCTDRLQSAGSGVGVGGAGGAGRGSPHSRFVPKNCIAAACVAADVPTKSGAYCQADTHAEHLSATSQAVTHQLFEAAQIDLRVVIDEGLRDDGSARGRAVDVRRALRGRMRGIRDVHFAMQVRVRQLTRQQRRRKRRRGHVHQA